MGGHATDDGKRSDPTASEPSDRDGAPPESDGASAFELDDVEVRDLLRKALSLPPASERPKTILKDVQQQIRSDSKGKFFADGWSTSEAPRATFLVTGIIMLLVALIAWLLLAPYGFTLSP